MNADKRNEFRNGSGNFLEAEGVLARVGDVEETGQNRVSKADSETRQRQKWEEGNIPIFILMLLVDAAH